MKRRGTFLKCSYLLVCGLFHKFGDVFLNGAKGCSHLFVQLSLLTSTYQFGKNPPEKLG